MNFKVIDKVEDSGIRYVMKTAAVFPMKSQPTASKKRLGKAKLKNKVSYQVQLVSQQ
jgi:hypothetical protein